MGAFISGMGCLKYFEHEKPVGAGGMHVNDVYYPPGYKELHIEYVIIGILGLLIHLLLTLGAVIRNTNVILAYIYLALIYNIVNMFLMGWAFSDEVHSKRASTYSYEFDYVRVFYVTLLYGGIIIGPGFAIKVAAAAMKEMKNGTEVPTDEKNDEKTDENNEKTEEV